MLRDEETKMRIATLLTGAINVAADAQIGAIVNAQGEARVATAVMIAALFVELLALIPLTCISPTFRCVVLIFGAGIEAVGALALIRANQQIRHELAQGSGAVR